MNDWQLTFDGFDPGGESLREALCTLGNGYFATRGAAEEASSDGVRYPGTYLAGGYNRLRSQVAGREIDSEDLVNFPNWLCLRIRVDGGPWFDPLHAELLRYRLCLDLENGTLERQIRFRDAEGRETSLSSRRLVSMADPHYAAIEMRLEAENWSGTLEIRSTIDSGVTNSGVARYRELAASHLQIEQLGHAGRDVAYSQVRTIQSALHVALAARTRAYLNDDIARAPAVPLLGTEIVGHDLQLTLRGGQSMAVEKIVALHCSRDHAIADCRQAACEAVTHAPRFEALWRRHRAAWPAQPPVTRRTDRRRTTLRSVPRALDGPRRRPG